LTSIHIFVCLCVRQPEKYGHQFKETQQKTTESRLSEYRRQLMFKMTLKILGYRHYKNARRAYNEMWTNGTLLKSLHEQTYSYVSMPEPPYWKNT